MGCNSIKKEVFMGSTAYNIYYLILTFALLMALSKCLKVPFMLVLTVKVFIIVHTQIHFTKYTFLKNKFALIFQFISRLVVRISFVNTKVLYSIIATDVTVTQRENFRF